MRRFKWIAWNEAKVAAHGLSPAEVEAAFHQVHQSTVRPDGSVRSLTELPSGQHLWVIWRYDRDGDEIPDVFGEVPDPALFVITAYRV